jgi:hypothetical protein
VRADYDLLLRRQREEGGRIANQKEVNVGIWTYKAMYEMVEDRGRMCEGVEGVFGRVYNKTLADGTGRELKDVEIWELRDSTDLVGDAHVEGAEMDADDASQTALLRARYQEQCVKKSEELDDLVDRLGDAKVGMGDGDVEMEDLVLELDCVKT